MDGALKEALPTSDLFPLSLSFFTKEVGQDIMSMEMNEKQWIRHYENYGHGNQWATLARA
jgi:hypothetical protein